jgi:hypothetical protein
MMMKTILPLLLVQAIHGYYQTKCNSWPSMLKGIPSSPGDACLKPIGFATDPTQATTPLTTSNMKLNTDSVGMRINVGESPSEILYTAFPTNGIAQSPANSSFSPLDLSSSSATQTTTSNLNTW